MNKSFSDGTSHTINDEVLWRKDGTSIPVEYSATPIVRDGTVAGAVIFFRILQSENVTRRLWVKVSGNFSQWLITCRVLFIGAWPNILGRC